MRVFITGIDGMLGSAIAIRHAKLGDEVHGCDVWDFTPAHMQCDIRDESRLRSMILSAQPDRIYHCAAMLGVKNTEDYPELCKQINEEGTRIVAAIASEVRAELVFTSSSEVYGLQQARLTETSPLLGNNVYAVSKVVGETYVKAHSNKLKVSVCRMFNCFGPHQVRQFFVPKAIDRALSGAKIPMYGDPQNMRSYLLSADAAKYIIDVANANVGVYQVVNIAHPELITLGYVVDSVMALTASKSTVETQRGDVYEDRKRTRDVPTRMADIKRLQSISQHLPVKFDDALRYAVQTFHTTRPDWTYSRETM